MIFIDQTLRAIAEHLGACEIEGDPETRIGGVAGLQEAGTGDLSFLSNPRYKKHLATTRASAVIVAPDVERPQGDAGGKQGPALLRMESPYLGFARALTFLVEPRPHVVGVHPGAHVDSSARLAADATVYPGAYVGADSVIGEGVVLHPGAAVMDRCDIGAGSTLYSGAVVREDCIVGKRVILHANTTIGSDGFGFAQDPKAAKGALHVKIPQIGNVVIEDDVEIGSCTCIDRAAVGSTVIERGTKIDDLVMIGHGTKVGADNLIVAHCAIAGSATLEDRVVLGGQVAVAGHIVVGEGSTVFSCSQVTKSVPPGSVVSGTPARPHSEEIRKQALLRRLEKMAERIAQLEERLKERS